MLERGKWLARGKRIVTEHTQVSFTISATFCMAATISPRLWPRMAWPHGHGFQPSADGVLENENANLGDAV